MRTALAVSLTALLTACNAGSPPPATTAAEPAAAASSAPAPVASTPASTLDDVLAGEWRSAENRVRDAWRHPRETLGFFGVDASMRVIEITPGGGWYSEVLAPWLDAQGHYVAALIDPASASSAGARDYYQESNDALLAKFGADPARFGRSETVLFDLKAPVLGAPGSADAVLTFRNVHNWRMSGAAPAMFAAFNAVLKPGGVLGVVEHRANGDVADNDRSGYVSEAQVIALAEAAGFVLEDKSEVNANPADGKDHPNGVWTLPPTNRHEAADAAKYAAIGESDRMTLRFRKAAQ